MNHINQVIGNYKIVRFINEGGLAFVYEGTEISTNAKVAIKVLKESYVHDCYQRDMHCSEDFQGYMNGGAETGRRAATDIISLLKNSNNTNTKK